MIPAPYVRLGHSVASGGDPHRHSLDRVVFRRQFDEMQRNTIAPCLPGPYSLRVHDGRQCRLKGEAVPVPLPVVEPAQELPRRRHGMSKRWPFCLNLVEIQKLDIGIESRKQLTRERRFAGTVGSSYYDCVRHRISSRSAVCPTIARFSGRPQPIRCHTRLCRRPRKATPIFDGAGHNPATTRVPDEFLGFARLKVLEERENRQHLTAREAGQPVPTEVARLTSGGRQLADERLREAVKLLSAFHRPKHHRRQVVPERCGGHKRRAEVARKIGDGEVRPRPGREPLGELTTLRTVIIADLLCIRQGRDWKRLLYRLLGNGPEVFSAHPR